MSTISDVARLAGVSKTTVSRVLNNNTAVNIETKMKILTAIEKLNYVPNINARGMRNKTTGTIGVVFPEYLNPFGYESIQHIEMFAAQAGYHTIITSIGSSKEAANRIRALVNRSIDGLVIYLYGIEPELRNYLYDLSLKKPVVFFAHYLFPKPVNKVVSKPGMRDIVNHLVERGRRKIGIIAVMEPHVYNDRLVDFQNTLRNLGIPLREDYIYKADYSLQSGFDAGQYFVGLGDDRPDAIVSFTDYMAIGAMNSLLRAGLSIPEDIAVAGYDGISLGRMTFPSLTTYRQDFERYGAEVINLLIRQIKDPGCAPREVLLDGTLIVREST